MINTYAIHAVVSLFFVLLLMAFAVFSIGFLLGYKYEERRIMKKTYKNIEEIKESEEEKKSKRDWKNFLKYDGSAINDKSGF